MNIFERHSATILAVLVAVIVAGVGVLVYRQAALPGSTEIEIGVPSPLIVVDVTGAVPHPGLKVLQEGDRVSHAISAAGGLAADADRDALNLAAPLRDGDRVHVYRLGEVPQKVNLNTAEGWLLESLPGIGDVLAQRIIDYRDQNGGFHDVDDLKNVEGISASTLEGFRDMVIVR
jgi:competence protein ComEA